MQPSMPTGNAFICRCDIRGPGEVALHCIANKVLAGIAARMAATWLMKFNYDHLEKIHENPLRTQADPVPISERPS